MGIHKLMKYAVEMGSSATYQVSKINPGIQKLLRGGGIHRERHTNSMVIS
jgi:hypothetical protein